MEGVYKLKKPSKKEIFLLPSDPFGWILFFQEALSPKQCWALFEGFDDTRWAQFWAWRGGAPEPLPQTLSQWFSFLLKLNSSQWEFLRRLFTTQQWLLFLTNLNIEQWDIFSQFLRFPEWESLVCRFNPSEKNTFRLYLSSLRDPSEGFLSPQQQIRLANFFSLAKWKALQKTVRPEHFSFLGELFYGGPMLQAQRVLRRKEPSLKQWLLLREVLSTPEWFVFRNSLSPLEWTLWFELLRILPWIFRFYERSPEEWWSWLEALPLELQPRARADLTDKILKSTPWNLFSFYLVPGGSHINAILLMEDLENEQHRQLLSMLYTIFDGFLVFHLFLIREMGSVFPGASTAAPRWRKRVHEEREAEA